MGRGDRDWCCSWIRVVLVLIMSFCVVRGISWTQNSLRRQRIHQLLKNSRFSHINGVFQDTNLYGTRRRLSLSSSPSSSSFILHQRSLNPFSLSAVTDSFLHSSIEDSSVSHLAVSGSQVDPYWLSILRRIERPSARALLSQLVPTSPLGFDASITPALIAAQAAAMKQQIASGSPYDDFEISNSVTMSGKARKRGTNAMVTTLLGFAEAEKRLHPQCVLLIRTGEFYETYGIDAVLLVGLAGLNPMGGRAKAGCPVRNLQATLDALTSAGLSVAVYEELTEVPSTISSTLTSKRASSISGLAASLHSTVPNGSSVTAPKSKLKTRALTQIVSPGASTYLYGLNLASDDIEFRPNRPAVGILKTPASGYVLCQAWLDEQRLVVSERLSLEAVRSVLTASGAADPIFIQDITTNDIPMLSSHSVVRLSGYDALSFPEQVLRRVGQHMEMDTSPFLRITDYLGENASWEKTSQENAYTDTSTVSSRGRGNIIARPRPLYTAAALQIGLLPNDNVPSLVESLLPRQSPYNVVASRWLTQWLLHPPPYHIADSLQALCAALSKHPMALPTFQPISVGKVISLLSAHQGNVPLFRDIRRNLVGIQTMLRQANYLPQPDSPSVSVEIPDEIPTDARTNLSEIVNSLLAITSYQSGVPAEGSVLLSAAERGLMAIDAVIASEEDAWRDYSTVDTNGQIPIEFFSRNEMQWRQKANPYHPKVASIYARVEAASAELIAAIRETWPSGCEVSHDMMENSIFLREKPVPAHKVVNFNEEIDPTRKRKTRKPSNEPLIGVDGVEYIPYIDRKGKSSSKRFTTDRVRLALARYDSANTQASLSLSSLFQELSSVLSTDAISLMQSSHWAVALQSILAHTVAARQKGWVLPPLQPLSELSQGIKRPLVLSQVRPYWLEDGVANDVVLDGLVLLTAPNMSGKSTWMRSLMVATLLANAGLFTPCQLNMVDITSRATPRQDSGRSSALNNTIMDPLVPRYDGFFVRMAGYDVPAEGKSSFALEMDDMRVICNQASSNSMVMIDELGRGTSARDGSALAGALLESLASRGVSGVFATHLHELLDLPLNLPGVVEKRMGIRHTNSSTISHNQCGTVEWTFKLEDGTCCDSMALETAAAYQIDNTVLTRAEELRLLFDSTCRGNYTSGIHSIDPTHTDPSTKPHIPPIQNTSEILRNYDLIRDVQPLLVEMFENDKLSDSGVLITSSQEPPAMLEGHSVVYILHLRPRPGSNRSDLLYVGETESIHQRLMQHRRSYRRSGVSVDCLALSVSNKSRARELESHLLQRFAEEGFAIEGAKDSTHRIFSSSESSV